MEKFFHVKEHGSTVRTEIVAGLTTFMAMAYILMVNASMFSALAPHFLQQILAIGRYTNL